MSVCVRKSEWKSSSCDRSTKEKVCIFLSPTLSCKTIYFFALLNDLFCHLLTLHKYFLVLMSVLRIQFEIISNSLNNNNNCKRPLTIHGDS